jgi:hypothetical protein
MLDEGNNLNMMETPEAPPPEEKSNRTFLIVGGVLAGLVFLTLCGMAVYYFAIYRPSRSQTQNAATQAAVIQTQNAQSIQNATLTAHALLWTPTLPPATPQPTGSSTPVIALGSPIATATSNPAILLAAQTQLASQLTSTAVAFSTTRSLGGGEMPSTGFFDEVGLPSLIILALALLVVIFLARRMRKSPVK